MPDDPKNLSFEKAMERLEGIVLEMESDQLPLEKLLSRFEEGVKLANYCTERLDSAEKRIRVITRDAEGRLKLEPLENAPGENAG